MSIKGTSEKLFVSKGESTILTFWGKKKRIDYNDLKRIDYMYSAIPEIGFLSFVNRENQETRFEFAKNANSEISKTVDFIGENMPNLELCEQNASDLKFYQRNPFVILISFILGFPLGLIGLYLMWHYKKSHSTGRMLVTFMALLFWGTCGYLSYTSYVSVANDASAAMGGYGSVLKETYNDSQIETTDGNDQLPLEQSNTSEYDTTYKASTYKVGQDIPPGEYVLFAEAADTHYFQISKDSSGTLKSISANGVFKTNTIVTVDKGQYFNFIGCYAVPITEVSKLDTTKEGMFKVGLHLEPGEYQIWPTDGSDAPYYAVRKDSTHILESIKTNGIAEGREYITLEKGDYLELQDCYIIK